MYTETEKTTSVEKIPHFNDNAENRSEKAQADKYVNDCGTNIMLIHTNFMVSLTDVVSEW